MSLTNLKKSKKGNFPIMLALSMITLLSFTFIKVVDHYQQVEATISESSLEILETYQIAEQLALETEVTARFIAEQVIMDLAWYPPSYFAERQSRDCWHPAGICWHTHSLHKYISSTDTKVTCRNH